jgi:hypothetical protein
MKAWKSRGENAAGPAIEPRPVRSGEAAFHAWRVGKASARRAKKKTPRKAGFSKMDARVNDAARAEYPRQGVVELVAGAP